MKELQESMLQFERYVNFEFYETVALDHRNLTEFERYVNFEFYETSLLTLSLFTRLRDM